MRSEPSALERILYGGFGGSSICIPAGLGTLIMAVLFPPIAVLYEQYLNGFNNINRIFMNLILTSMFYFPGLLHALSGMNCYI